VLEAYDQYVEPMNQMMDTGPQGTFYRYLEDAERSLDLAFEQLSVQGGLYSHRLQLRQVAHQAKELRRFGRLIAQQCADTVLPLREEMRQHNALTSAVSMLLGQVRKRGLRRALSCPTGDTALPVWRNERGFRLQLGDEVRAVMAAARQYQPQSVAFPQDEPDNTPFRCWSTWTSRPFGHTWPTQPAGGEPARLAATRHHAHLQDATLLRLFHDLQHEQRWQFEACQPARENHAADDPRPASPSPREYPAMTIATSLWRAPLSQMPAHWPSCSACFSPAST
jgi:hypothetical protein